MNILRHLNLSTATWSADEPAAEVIEQPVESVAEVPAEEITPEPEPAPEEPAVEAKPESSAHGNKGQTPWFQKVIGELREDRRHERTAREAAEQRAADLQAIIDRIQAGEKPELPKTATSRAQPDDFSAAVKAQAAKDRLYEDTLAVRSAGEEKFADFQQTLKILTDVGATSDDFVADVLAVDKAGAHIILDKLAKDPDKALSLVGMDQRRRIMELTRMADAPKAEVKAEPKPEKTVSKAPAPKPAISPLAPAAEVDPTTADGNEKMSDAQWEKWYKTRYMKRA
jgi:hypothetical protein